MIMWMESELSQDWSWRAGIDGKPCPNRGACGVIDLVNQSRGKFDELAGFFLIMRRGLNIEVGEHAEQGGTNIDTLPVRETHQAIKAREWRNTGHGKGTRQK